MPRGFKLINEKGQKFYMNNLNDYCFLENPTGLGVSYSREYDRLENTFVESLKKREQSKPSGKVLFSSYDNYLKFVNYIENSEALKLAYSIPFENGVKEYYRNVNIQGVSKSEMQKDNLLSETIEICCLSLWYEEKTIQINGDSGENNDVIRWDFRWDSRFSSYSSVGSLNFLNNGHVAAPVEIEMSGRIVNPQMELWVEGEKYQEITFSTTIEEFEKLLYGTRENDFHVLKENTDGTRESLLSLDVIDFDNDNVLRFPKNRSCELKFSSDAGLSNIKITIFVYYTAV